MNPKKFEQCNKVWGAPPGQEDSVNAMHAYQGIEEGSGWPVTISAWVVRDEDLERIEKERTVYLRVYGKGHPVVSLSSENPWGDTTPLDLPPGLRGEEIIKLRKFKQYVHDRLDNIGIPSDPEPEQNKEHGCRIEGRLNYVEHKLQILKDKESVWDHHPSTDK